MQVRNGCHEVLFCPCSTITCFFGRMKTKRFCPQFFSNAVIYKEVEDWVERLVKKSHGKTGSTDEISHLSFLPDILSVLPLILNCFGFKEEGEEEEEESLREEGVMAASVEVGGRADEERRLMKGNQQSSQRGESVRIRPT